MSFLCCDIRFYVVKGNGHSMGSTVMTKLAKSRKNYAATEQFYVAIELDRVGRKSVTIKDFWVATKLAMIESSAAHDRPGHVKARAHHSAVPRYVMTEKAMLVRQTKPGTCNRPS